MKSVFYASPNTAPQIFSLIQKKIPFFPVSTRELSLPEIELPESGIVVQTSGSSGKSKYAHLSLESFFWNAQFPYPDLILGMDDCYLLSVPLYHVSGLSILFRALDSGCSMGDGERVTHISFVPTQLKRFLQKPSPFPNLKAILVGGAPIPYALCKEAYDRGFNLYLTYGMTEMASQIATQKFHPDTGISFGSPLPHREVKIEDGEIWVRGKTLFQGYLNHPSPFIDGWFPTKDLGRIGLHGLEILGRKDRMFISGGENIHPEEIEQALLSHPKIFSCKVSSKPDNEFGRRPIALVATTLTHTAVRDHLEILLPRYKLPEITITDPDASLTLKG